MSAMPHDARRKLEMNDYKKIRLYLDQNYTIREVAATFNCSTKYVKRVAQGEFTFANDGSVTFSTAPDHIDPPMVQLPTCSGCGMSFGQSGLQGHYDTYTSGGTKALECGVIFGR